MAEPTKPVTKGPMIYALNLETNEVVSVPASDISKLPDPSKVQLFAKESDATVARDERIVAKALRDHQIARAKAKVERDRAAYAERFPARARAQAQKSAAALEAHIAKIEAEKPSKKKGTGEG